MKNLRAPVAAAVVFCVAVTCAGSSVAEAAPAGPLLERLDRSAKDVSTLAGDFTQKSRIKLFKQELSSRGRFAFERPRRIRWEYLAPDPSVLVLDGDKATLATPGAAPQVFDLGSDATMKAIFDQLAMWLAGSGLGSARADYDMDAGGSDAEPTLVLTPKAGSVVAKAFARIELRFEKTLLLKQILLREKSGDEKQIDLKVVRNPKLPAGSFKI